MAAVLATSPFCISGHSREVSSLSTPEVPHRCTLNIPSVLEGKLWSGEAKHRSYVSASTNADVVHIEEAKSQQQQNQATTRFRPCIDIHRGKVKQIVGSTLRDIPDDSGASTSTSLITNFESEKSSSEYAKMYRADDLPGGHVIMLGADEDSQQAAVEALHAYPGGLQVGGGITPQTAVKYLDAGASHVIVTSFVFREGRIDRNRLRELRETVGRSRLVLDLSCRRKDGLYWVVTDRWQKFSDFSLSAQSIAELAGEADEFLVHGVDVEGMRLGIDEELVRLLGLWSPIPVTYAGGVRSLEDLERVEEAGGGAVHVTVGSALDIFGGNLPYADVVAWHRRQQQK
eukprot:TRINITY_DN4676_c0_g1_i1.p1 TRINITY_DN4676_c0_g1~~TRINITY_DN4676_c0_g1_i1.p1  ORF type:complete len:344 (+),score=77.67 TRINITY_DN4676_c0_g1_i1:180-1211(+)